MALQIFLDKRKKPPLWRIYARAPGSRSRGRIAHDEDLVPLDRGGYVTENEAQDRISALHPHQALTSEARVYMQARAKAMVESLPIDLLPPGRRDDPIAVAHHHGVDPLADSMPSLWWMQKIEKKKQVAADEMLDACGGDLREAGGTIDDAGRWIAATEVMRSGIRKYTHFPLQAIAIQVQGSEIEMSDSEKTAALAEIQRSLEAGEIAEGRGDG